MRGKQIIKDRPFETVGDLVEVLKTFPQDYDITPYGGCTMFGIDHDKKVVYMDEETALGEILDLEEY